MAVAISPKRANFRWRIVALAFACLWASLPAGAQSEPGDGPQASPPAAAQSAPAATPGANTDTKVQERADRLRELQGIEQSLQASEEERKRIEGEIAALNAEREQLKHDLVAAADRVRALEERASGAETRLAQATSQEQALKVSLESRRELIGEVLAALQRIGGRPPPAVIVSAQDILVAVRATTVLGSVLPQLREEARTLSSDLDQLAKLRTTIATERDGLKDDLAQLGQEHTRLAALIAQRQASVATDEVALGEAGKRSATLTQRAKSLHDFLASLDAEIAQNEKKAADLAASTQASFNVASLKEPTRLAPKIAFADARGLLSLPVVGTVSRDFGDPDEVTGTARGISITTRPSAIVTSPSEGVIAHAGAFRGYGQLLIINAGNGYHIVLAGLGHIDVAAGQAVLAGEPVGEMGEGNMLSTEMGKAPSGEPVLYVEFRKDGSAINPGPWWAKIDQRKVRG